MGGEIGSSAYAGRAFARVRTAELADPEEVRAAGAAPVAKIRHPYVVVAIDRKSPRAGGAPASEGCTGGDLAVGADQRDRAAGPIDVAATIGAGDVHDMGVGDPHVALAVAGNRHRAVEDPAHMADLVVAYDGDRVAVVAGDPREAAMVDGDAERLGEPQPVLGNVACTPGIPFRVYGDAAVAAIGDPNIAVLVRDHALGPRPCRR